MKTAREMRETALFELERRENEKKLRIQDYIENHIMPDIEKWAKLGMFDTVVCITDFEPDDIINELLLLGYTVEYPAKAKRPKNIKISWEN